MGKGHHASLAKGKHSKVLMCMTSESCWAYFSASYNSFDE